MDEDDPPPPAEALEQLDVMTVVIAVIAVVVVVIVVAATTAQGDKGLKRRFVRFPLAMLVASLLLHETSSSMSICDNIRESLNKDNETVMSMNTRE